MFFEKESCFWNFRVDGEFWHYRLKRDGRIFVVNQTVFENLNQIVDFYSAREFVRGVCLKYPVNEKNVGKYSSGEISVGAAPGCYMELKDIEKEKERLQKEKKHLEGEIKRASSMLQNEKFTSKAPKEMVDAEKDKLENFKNLLVKVEEMITKYSV